MGEIVGAKVEKRFEELKAKIGAVIEIKPDAKYLVVFKEGVLSEQDAAIFQNLWRQIMGGALVMIVTANPEKDIKVLEMK